MLTFPPVHLNAQSPAWRSRCLFLVRLRRVFEVDDVHAEDKAFLQRLCDVFCYLFEFTTGEKKTAVVFTPIQ